MSSGRFHTKESYSGCKTIGKEPDAVGQWSIADQEDEARAAPSAFLEINGIRILNEIDNQLLILSHAAAALEHVSAALNWGIPLKL